MIQDVIKMKGICKVYLRGSGALKNPLQKDFVFVQNARVPGKQQRGLKMKEGRRDVVGAKFKPDL